MAEAKSLAGKRALVSGSVAGLGFAMAQALAREGAAVMLHGIEAPEAAEEVRAGLAAECGVAVGYVQADLRQSANVRAMVDATVAELGGIDILVNNAVVRAFASIDEMPLERWEEAIAVNLNAAFHATKLVLPMMRANSYGRIFNMTSVYSQGATTGRADYITTKTALLGLTRATAMEVAGSPVSCHSLTPGSVETPIWKARLEDMARAEGLPRDEAERKFQAGKNPSGRFVAMDSVAQVLVMLCGKIGEDMNGANMPIEAGWLARA